MSHLSDKDIDRLAQEAAEQLDLDQNSSGWDALEKTLDREMPTDKKRRRRWFFFILLPAVLLGGMFGVYQLVNRPVSKAKSIQTSSESIASRKSEGTPVQSIPNSSSSQPSAKKERQGAEQDAKTESSIPSPEKKKDIQAPGSTPLISKSKVRPKNPGVLFSRNNPISQRRLVKKEPGQTGKDSYQPADQTSIPQPTKNEKQSSGITKNRASDTGTDEVASNQIVEPVENNNSLATPTDSVNHVPNVANYPTDSLTAGPDTPNHENSTADSLVPSAKPTLKPGKKKPGESMPSKGLVLGLLTGPDISDVNRKGTGKTGVNIGLSVGYRLNPRLTILSGLFYTHKFYTAYGNDYKPPKGLWFDTVTLSRVIGDCFMYEIPVNLRFDLVARNRNYLFASAGLSSYLMRKENYDFHFTGNSGYYGSWYRSYKVKENYWLGVLNLSAGYERMIGRQWSLLAEPYIKLPLKGLGFGNMQLNSYGLYLGVRFQPQKPKKK